MYNDFPVPRPFPIVCKPIPPPQSPQQTSSNADNVQGTPVQGSAVPGTPARNLPPVPPFPTSSATTTTNVPDSLPPSQHEATPPAPPIDEIPALLIQMLNGITTTLRSAFAEKPPHTIQRLAELVLHPTKHYKTLPAWLRAVDRVVGVSSSADIFPLAQGPPTHGIVNGIDEKNNPGRGGGILFGSTEIRNGYSYDANNLGSDESLGGALLTPIPWLKNGLATSSSTDSLDSSDDASRSGNSDMLADPTLDLPPALSQDREQDPLVPEREGGAVTQGELIRMEQEAGVVPVTHSSRPVRIMGINDDMDDEDEDEEEDEGELEEMDEESEAPRARGPDLVGTVDMGKVGGMSVQVPLTDAGTSTSASSNSPDRRRTGKVGPVDVNDAQEVLKGSGREVERVDQHRPDGRHRAAASGPSAQVAADDDDDEMLIDQRDGSETTASADSRRPEEEDGNENEGDDGADVDVILSDADGRPDGDEQVSGKPLLGAGPADSASWAV